MGDDMPLKQSLKSVASTTVVAATKKKPDAVVQKKCSTKSKNAVGVDISAHIRVQLQGASPLKQFLLSAASCPPEPQPEPEPSTLLSELEILELLRTHVPKLDETFSRDQRTPVGVYIVESYRQGWPLFRSNAALQQQLVHALRYICAHVKDDD